MIGKLLPHNTFLLALIVLFCSICLLPINLLAQSDTDHDNIDVNDVAAQTSLSVSYYDPSLYCNPYANILNFSDISVRYYFSASLSVYWNDRTLFHSDSDADKGWVAEDDSISFVPSFDLDMSGEREGNYTAYGAVSLLLKFDFNGDGVFDDTPGVDSSASIDFSNEEE